MEIICASNHHLIESVFLLRQCIDELERQHIVQWDNTNFSLTEVQDDIEKQTVYVARNNNITVGTITVNESPVTEYNQIKWGYKSEKVLIVHNFAVFPAWQKKGIGRKMMDFIENLAVDKGYESIRLHLHYDNMRAINFFKRRDYNMSGEFTSEVNQNKYVCFEKILVSEYAS